MREKLQIIITLADILARICVEKPDLILAEDAYEYGCSEAGGGDNAGVGVKEVFERRIKLIKTMKGMPLRLHREPDYDMEAIHKVIIFVGLAYRYCCDIFRGFLSP